MAADNLKVKVAVFNRHDQGAKRVRKQIEYKIWK